MADLNVTYHPYVHQYDIREIKNELLYEFYEEGSEVRNNMDRMLIIPLTEFNSAQQTLADAVSLPYTGTTSEERVKWLQDRIEAVYDRLDMIREDSEANRTQILNAGGAPPIDALNVIGSVLAVFPPTKAVGTFTQLLSKLVNRSNDNEAWKRQKIQEATAVIQGYAVDAPQLSLIQKQLYTELSATGNVPKSTGTLDSLFAAAKAWPVWYYFAGFAVLIILLLIIRKRRLAK